MRIRGILFDMDGLMFDTERISSLAFDHVERSWESTCAAACLT
ncbi:MAG: hypothetical protein ACLSHJ_07360 [Oscillospiraceae bacterium]